MTELYVLLRTLRTCGNPDRAITVAEMEEILSAIVEVLRRLNFNL